MRKQTTVFFGAIALLALAGAGCGTTNSLTTSDTTNTARTGTVFSASDVAAHASVNDCWVIVSKSVYDVTNFIPEHPGGPEQIVPLCGRDATLAFTARDGMGPHPDRATATLKKYLVGITE